MKTYVVRRNHGFAGLRNHYFHADIKAKNKREALVIARKGGGISWRWIDSFDTCDKSYIYYEILGSRS